MSQKVPSILLGASLIFGSCASKQVIPTDSTIREEVKKVEKIVEKTDITTNDLQATVNLIHSIVQDIKAIIRTIR